MKTNLLTALAAATITASLLGILFNIAAVGLFAVAVSAFVLLIGATDYAPPARYAPRVGAESRARLPLAA